MDKYVKAVLKETGKIPSDVITDGGKLRVDVEHGLIYPIVAELGEEKTLVIFQEVFPDLKSFSDTFHKSWSLIEDTPQEQLWAQAAIHYFTTYGLESLNIDNQDLVYVPDEVDCTPELRQFRFIGSIDVKELNSKIDGTLSSGVALKRSTIENYLTICEHTGHELNIDSVNNKELRTILQVRLGIIPTNAEELMRVINYKLTGETLLIKNSLTRSRYGYSAKSVIKELTDGAEILATAFYRYKPLLLALRSKGSEYKRCVNRIRRMAKRMWQPKPDKLFLSTRIANALDVHYEELEAMSNYDLAKIYNKLAYITNSPNTVKYNIVPVRNGKLFIDLTPLVLTEEGRKSAEAVQQEIKDLLRSRLNPQGLQRIILPQGLELAFPTSEKSFIGSLPLYSQARTSGVSTIGISWKEHDLDLSALLSNGDKVGWNSDYTSAAKDVLYSGDMTRGGAEALLFKSDQPALIMLNIFYGEVSEVNLFFSQELEFSYKTVTEDNYFKDKEYILDPNNIVYSVKLELDGNSKVLGVFDKQEEDIKFTFVDMGLGQANVARSSDLSSTLIQVLGERGDSSLKLSDIFPSISAEEYEENCAKFDGVEYNLYQSMITDLRDYDKTKILTLVNHLLIEPEEQ